MKSLYCLLLLAIAYFYAEAPSTCTVRYGTEMFSSDVVTHLKRGKKEFELTFTCNDAPGRLGRLTLEIREFTGAGVYDLQSGNVIVYATQDGHAFYWKSFYSEVNRTVYARGSVAVARCDHRYIAKAHGELYHEEFNHGDMALTKTSFEAGTDECIRNAQLF
ncbi:hypothetical protein [Sphingobacterium suaedae]|uniref:Uncharacterized protein n=1 Tax=Sphingobacterium suaedae TaxID=1686402 RepID=A0ABW5KG70_9SPHI